MTARKVAQFACLCNQTGFRNKTKTIKNNKRRTNNELMLFFVFCVIKNGLSNGWVKKSNWKYILSIIEY